MKTLNEYINESNLPISLKQLQDAVYSNSMMNDQAWIKIDGKSYYKIKADEWEMYDRQASSMGGRYKSKDLFELIKKASDVDTTLMSYKK